MGNQYVQFRSGNPSSISAVKCVIDAFIADAQSDIRMPDDKWRELFSQDALAYFWWPTTEEKEEWKALWFGTHHSKRHLLPRTRWDFDSLIETIKTNEWNILGVSIVDGESARVEFISHAYPFGGVGCLIALLEAMGNEVTESNDGTGVRNHEQTTEYWRPGLGLKPILKDEEATKQQAPKPIPKRKWWQLWR